MAALASGVFVGLFFKPVGLELKILGDLFVSLLSMCSLPIIIMAVINSIAKTLRDKSAKLYLGRTLVVLVAGVLLCAAVSALCYLCIDLFFNIDEKTLDFLGKALLNHSQAKVPNTEYQSGLLNSLIPENIFAAFSSGRLLAMLFVSVLIGAPWAFCRTATAGPSNRSSTTSTTFFMTILDWSFYFLPFGLFGLMASAAAQMGAEVIQAMALLIGVVYVSILLTCGLYFLAVRQASGQPMRVIIHALKQPIFIAFVTQDPLPAMPMAMKEMAAKLKFPKVVADFAIPTTVTLNGHNLTIQLVPVALFVALIFNVHLDAGQYLLLMLLAAFPGSLAGPSLPTLMAIVPYVFAPFGLPIEAGAVALLLSSPIVSPICGVHTLLSACANTALISNARPAADPAEATLENENAEGGPS